ncbi:MULTISPECIES: hypothetical protein [Metabacillus]|uniref:hypothetical protein n=1 Tax=Metabacillus TaxID=2675233 RepID=UPI000C80A142|nr:MULTISPECIES: hypothetical protein [Metabacillus]MCM3443603.1 hypothetical protein [Metabacillus halosaccharovorans]PMC34237.1 hypothetical protein CJ195_24275 [Bacillus sp. UMB0899]
MDFDINKFATNLKKRDKPANESKDLNGYVNAIRYIWNHYSIEEIDFNCFSYKDVIKALDSMEDLPLISADDSEEVFYVDPNNEIIEYARIENTLARLFHHKNKHFRSDEEILFI